MAEEEDSPELQVARLFQLAGHEVTQAVGEEPGTVDWFATPREGFVRPRTYWQAWKTCPERLDEALEALERARGAKHADRALGVVMGGSLPEGYTTDLTSTTTGVITLRRLGLELAGVIAEVRRYVEDYERSRKNESYLPRRVRLQDGEARDGATYVEEWVRSSRDSALAITGPPDSGCTTVMNQARYINGKQFITAPDATPALIVEPRDGDLIEHVADRGWVVLFDEHPYWEIRDNRDYFASLTARYVLEIEPEHEGLARLNKVTTLTLIEPSPRDIEGWYIARVASPVIRERLVSTCRQIPGFRALSEALPNLSLVLEAMKSTSHEASDADSAAWAALVVTDYVRAVERMIKEDGTVFRPGDKPDFYIDQLEDVALEQFGMGRIDLLHHRPQYIGERLYSSTWMTSDEEQGAAEFVNPLIFHYFLARKIAREVRSGNLDILTRYQFPREYVLLFLAILAPDVAAQATAERGEAIRAQIENEVERRLQLTLAHALKRSAGAVRAHLKAIQRHVERTSPGAMEHEFARIDEEAAFQCALAEQTRLWHEVPESEIVGLSLAASLEAVVADLRETHPRIACQSAVDATLRVRATQEVLREILHCLLENAFQAVAFAEAVTDPRVCVEARTEGGTIRVDVLDNGPGVAPGDRERIFNLYVSTKKGSDDRPLGTGMGLPIARRYAEHVGGQVGLDPERGATCFFVRLVAWRDIV